MSTLHTRPSGNLRIGTSHIFDSVCAADLRAAKYGVKACFGSSTFYHGKEQLCAITEEKLLTVWQVFAELGYDGTARGFEMVCPWGLRN